MTKTYKKEESDEELKKRLSLTQYNVTQKASTESPHSSEYNSNYEKGLYVDIVTGEPLFLSTAKFDAGCGWPSFSKPVDEEFMDYKSDTSFGMKRTEVKSKFGGSHLGHLFNDGPLESGGLRYCINGAALRFVPFDKLEEEGYEEYIELF